ncbi:MAG TPA: class II aldolase/adducin family protein [Polyangiales bacterium]
MNEERASRELAAMGEALGGLLWVQGPGGNCSVKVGSELWVKASGTRFAEVASPAGHVKLPLELAKRALAGDADADREVFQRSPRPSLETYFHALGADVVAHTHALGVLLYACSNAPLAEARKGYFEIPYVRPGRGIATTIEAAFCEPGVDGLVCVLRNHGIVAYADTALAAVALTKSFDARAREAAEKAGPLAAFEPMVAAYLASPERTFEGGVFRSLPRREAPETNPPRYLFPDAAVCASIVLTDAIDDDSAQRALSTIGRALVLVDPQGARIAVARTSTQLQQTCEVAAAHDWLEDALRARGSAHYLDADEPARILSLPSEQYRMQLAATKGPL